MQWLEFHGQKRRGDRESLVLDERPEDRSRTAKSTCGKSAPPPLSRIEWEAIRAKHIKPHLLNHTDGAQVYLWTDHGQLRDSVQHGRYKKRMPEFSKVVEHGPFAAKSGTQSLDGWLKRCREMVSTSQISKGGNCADRVRQAQWLH